METTAPIKTSEDLRLAYVEERWAQLSELAVSWGDEWIKYLLLVNTAGMAGALSFIGAMPSLRPLIWPRLMLCLFACGVVIVGLYHAMRHRRIEWMFREWQTDSDAYRASTISYNTLLDDDKKREKKFDRTHGLAYVAFACFLAGIIVAGTNFNDITKLPLEKNNERKEASPESAGVTTVHPPAPPLDATNTGAKGERERGAKGAAPASGSDAAKR